MCEREIAIGYGICSAKSGSFKTKKFIMDETVVRADPGPWNKGKLVGQKAPFKLKEIWAIRIRLQLSRRARNLALFDLGIDSKLRACDLVRLRVRDIWNCPSSATSPQKIPTRLRLGPSR
jgi:hypothetical protein